MPFSLSMILEILSAGPSLNCMCSMSKVVVKSNSALPSISWVLNAPKWIDREGSIDEIFEMVS